MTVTFSVGDIMTVALLAALVATWAAGAAGSFSAATLLACEVVFFAFYLTGSLFAAWTSLAAGVLFDLPLRLLVGYGVVNTALLAMAWVSPLGMIANFCVLLIVPAFLLVAAGERKCARQSSVTLLAVGVCAVATTLWCQDSIDPTSDQGNWVLFKPWVDGFYHAVHIRTFAESHGASTIEDFRMARIPARVYHYGVYMMPAVIKQASNVHSYAAFAGILAPVGVLFTGFAAYAFFGSLWGRWPGFTACAALLLLPDGNQQFGQNTYLSYHWLTQISPSATYGLALLAVTWLFVIQGCTRKSRLQLCAGWLVSVILVAYKLHFAIASALLLLLVPAVAFRGALSLRARIAACLAACVVYAAVLTMGQVVPGMPVIRFDGSGVGEIQRLIQSFQVAGSLQDFMAERSGPLASAASNLIFGVPYVLGAALGVFLPLVCVLVFCVRARVPSLHTALPIFVLANFLVMFCGLALDMDSSTPDELSHRPLMIVYFFVVTWVGGLLGLMAETSRRFGRFAPRFVTGIAVVLMVVPLFFGSGVQLLRGMPAISPLRVPKALVTLAEHMRTHGDRTDIFQDSQFDRVYALAALSERRPFVDHTLTRMSVRGDEVARRSAAVNRLMLMDKAPFVVATAHAFGVRWFVLQKGDRVHWPPELLDNPALEAGRFRLYAF